LIKEILAKQPQVDAKELVRLVLKQEKPEWFVRVIRKFKGD
jgi:hypothetical protein